MTGSGGDEGERSGETSVKRRLSLRIGGIGGGGGGVVASPEKKARGVGSGGGGHVERDLSRSMARLNGGPVSEQAPREWEDSVKRQSGRIRHTHSHSHSHSQSQQPTTAESSRFAPSHLSYSPTSSVSADDYRPPKSVSSRSVVASSSTRRIHPPPLRAPLSATSSTYSRSRPSMPPTWRTASSSENEQVTPTQSIASTRSSSKHPFQLSTSASSRVPSPPPSFNLSSGQPLVNPPMKTQAAFVGKLYAMLEDEDIVKTGLIHWSVDGTVFTCPNPTEFSRVVLPRFFKHNNWQSFVRQLNMYSFNKISSNDRLNDLFATTPDPGAWEFRHALFRRGEPHLLASIKRKTTRPTNQDVSPPVSPKEEIEPPKRVAGWMRENNRHGSLAVSSPRDPDVVNNRPGVPNLLTGEVITSRAPVPAPPVEDRRPNSSSGYQWETSSQPPLTARMPPPIDTISQRYHPDPGRSLQSAHRFGLTEHPGFPGSALYSQHQQSPVGALAGQVAILEDRVQRLTETLNNERIDNVRNHLDYASYMLHMMDWLRGDRPPAEADISALRDTLNRKSAELRQKYETSMASDALASMAHESRPSSFNLPEFTSRPPSSKGRLLPDPRVSLSTGPTPRTSPLISHFPDLPPRTFPPLGPHPPLGNPSSHSATYPASSQFTSHRPVHSRGSLSACSTGREAVLPCTSRHRGAGKVVTGSDRDETMEDVKPKTGLSSLLN